MIQEAQWEQWWKARREFEERQYLDNCSHGFSAEIRLAIAELQKKRLELAEYESQLELTKYRILLMLCLLKRYKQLLV